MSERDQRLALIVRYLRAHRDELERLDYWRLEFVAAGPAPLRATFQRSDQLLEDAERLTARLAGE